MKPLPTFGSDAWLKELRKALACPTFNVKPPALPLERPTDYRCAIKGEWIRCSVTDRQWSNLVIARSLIDAAGEQ